MPFPFRKKETGESMKKYVVIYQNDSIDPIIYGLFYSEKKAKKYIEGRYKDWDKYDDNNNASLQVQEVKAIK